MNDANDRDDVFASLRAVSNQVAAQLLQLAISWPSTVSSYTVYLMKPQTVVFVTIVLLVALIANNFEYFSNLCTKITFCRWPVSSTLTKMTGKANALLGNGDCATNNDIHEIKRDNVGGFGIRGRRPKMEDRMQFYDESERSGIQLYGVFDGHGGDSAAIYVQQRLFKAIVNRVEDFLFKPDQVPSTRRESKLIDVEPFENSFIASKTSDNNENNKENLNQQTSSLRQQSSDEDSDCPTSLRTSSKSQLNDCYSSPSTDSPHSNLNTNKLTKLMSDEVVKLDNQLVVEFKQSSNLAGTTCIFALRTPDNQLLVANTGDSRGVLCNSRGQAVPLSYDHKPQLFKEHKRIKEAGGFIKFTGVWRVAGVLATSRAIGDYPLKDKKFVIPDPDVLVFDLNEVQPQFIILASDGLWDCFSNEDAVNYVRESITSLRKRQIKKELLAYEAAKLLVAEAYRRLSVDNISVMITTFDTKEFKRRSGFVPSMSSCSRRKSSMVRAIS